MEKRKNLPESIRWFRYQQMSSGPSETCSDSVCFYQSDLEVEPAREAGKRPQKRRCFWEYRCARETASKKKLGGDVRWSLSWSSSTLPSTLYRREGENHLESTSDPACSHCHIGLHLAYVHSTSPWRHTRPHVQKYTGIPPIAPLAVG